MKNTNLITYKNYIIDIENLTYKAVWDCQVEWTDECIFYDAETGHVIIEDGDIEFIREQQHRVTKHEYIEHVAEARSLLAVNEDALRQRFGYREVI